MKITYLFTTFPVRSETFLQRELRLMAKQGAELEIHSLWKGDKEWEGYKIRHFRHRYLLKLLWALPYWAIRRPSVLRNATQRLLGASIPSMQNLGELLMGLGFGIVMARTFEKAPPNLLHAAWATMPATAAWLINQITGIPYSFGAHAYDIFRHGGDCLLDAKVRSARMIHTTTKATRKRLIQLGGKPESIHLIRHGLDHFPECKAPRIRPRSIRFITVGRMVAKKGYFAQLKLYAALKAAGVRFEVRFIGDGPLKNDLIIMRKALGLRKEVTFTGWMENDAVMAEYAWADAFVFTGIVAPDGDRDGLPNVIPEAMAAGLCVMTTPIMGTTEAIRDGQTGFVCQNHDIASWLRAIHILQTQPEQVGRIIRQARRWVETNFECRQNAAILAKKMQEAVGYCNFVCPVDFPTSEESDPMQKPSGISKEDLKVSSL